ncbi:MAG TPA: ATP-binding protein [Gemmatimonadaceae bacterium]|jgi:two-component system sensor histidine kinase KdpD
MPISSRSWLPRWLFWTLVLALVTCGMLVLRDDLDQAHVALIYLMVVLGASASGGRAVGIGLACAGFALIDFFFQPPFDTITIGKRPDWLVLIAFLATAAVATHLLARARAEAEGARRSAEEIDRLSSLGAETLSVGRAEDALGAIAHVVRDTIGAAVCEIYVREGERDILVRAAGSDEHANGGSASSRALVAWVAANGRIAAERLDGSVFRAAVPPSRNLVFAPGVNDARALLVPLVVHERTVGVLRLADRQAIALDGAQRRFLAALSYYAALGVERVRLVAEAEHAEALREADQLKDALLASVSHDLRTPLTTIKALAHDIAFAGDERAAVIEQQADRLNRMVADLLELSRLNAGALPVRRELNAAEDLVGAAIQQVAGTLNGREVRASIQWSEPVLVGHFDFVHSLRILVNLIENAIKYSPPDTPIDIEVVPQDGMLLISVADRGPGISSSERERIFDPFYRLIPGVSPDDGAGAGLGLAIARRLADAQGGDVTYGDRAGGGSRFTLSLPAASLGEGAVAEPVGE